MLGPDSPVPPLRVALMAEDVHVTRLPVVASLSTTRPDLAVTAPPGRTVHVVAAMADVTVRTVANPAAGTVNRVRAKRLLIRKSGPPACGTGPPSVWAAQDLIVSDLIGLWAGDRLVGAHEVGALERAGVAAADQAGAAVDVVDVQVPGTGRGQPACAVAVLGRHPAVVGGCARAVYHGAAARAGQRGVDAGDRARGDAAAEGHGVQVPREVGRVHREGQPQRAGATAERQRRDGPDTGPGQPAAVLERALPA